MGSNFTLGVLAFVVLSVIALRLQQMRRARLAHRKGELEPRETTFI